METFTHMQRNSPAATLTEKETTFSVLSFFFFVFCSSYKVKTGGSREDTHFSSSTSGATFCASLQHHFKFFFFFCEFKHSGNIKRITSCAVEDPYPSETRMEDGFSLFLDADSSINNLVVRLNVSFILC